MVLLASFLVLSAFLHVEWNGGHNPRGGAMSVSIDNGGLGVGYGEPALLPGPRLRTIDYKFPWRWWPPSFRQGNQPSIPYRYWSVSVPLWIPLAIFAIPTSWAWIVHFRARPWRCRRGYDLRGLSSPVCPECGRSFTPIEAAGTSLR